MNMISQALKSGVAVTVQLPTGPQKFAGDEPGINNLIAQLLSQGLSAIIHYPGQFGDFKVFESTWTPPTAEYSGIHDEFFEENSADPEYIPSDHDLKDSDSNLDKGPKGEKSQDFDASAGNVDAAGGLEGADAGSLPGIDAAGCEKNK